MIIPKALIHEFWKRWFSIILISRMDMVTMITVRWRPSSLNKNQVVHRQKSILYREERRRIWSSFLLFCDRMKV